MINENENKIKNYEYEEESVLFNSIKCNILKATDEYITEFHSKDNKVIKSKAFTNKITTFESYKDFEDFIPTYFGYENFEEIISVDIKKEYLYYLKPLPDLADFELKINFNKKNLLQYDQIEIDKQTLHFNEVAIDILNNYENTKNFKYYVLSSSFTNFLSKFCKIKNSKDLENSSITFFIQENFKNIDYFFFKKIRNHFNLIIPEEYTNVKFDDEKLPFLLKFILSIYWSNFEFRMTKNTSFISTNDNTLNNNDNDEFFENCRREEIQMTEINEEVEKLNIKNDNVYLTEFQKECYNNTEISNIEMAYNFYTMSSFFKKKIESNNCTESIELDLYKNFTKYNEYFKFLPIYFHSLSFINKLTSIDLKDNVFDGPYSLIGLGKAISINNSIKKINLKNCKIDVTCFQNFVNAASMNQKFLSLEEFDISNNFNKKEDDGSWIDIILSFITYCPNLTELILSKNVLGKKSSYFFEGLSDLCKKNFLKLDKFFLESMQIDEDGMFSIGNFLEEKKCILTAITLSDNTFSEKLFQIDNKFRLFSNLKELYLLKCKIKNLEVIVDFIKINKSISYLNLCNNNIEKIDYFLEKIIFSNENTSLLNIDFSRNNLIIDEGLVSKIIKNKEFFKKSGIKVIDITWSKLDDKNKVPDISSSFIIVKDEQYPKNSFNLSDYFNKLKGFALELLEDDVSFLF